ncbi:MAG: EamA family transporter, partial [Ignavibacteria bacterium]|nr:EamA family transporter [Ignavibacteria bacterium]
MKNLMLLVFITLAATFTPIFAKLSVAEISPLSFGFFRFGTAAILFFITLKIRKQDLKFERKDYPRLLLLSLLCIPLNQFFFLSGIKLSFASHSGIIYSLNPVYAYIIAVLIRYEKFKLSKLFSILLTVLGIVFIFYENFTATQVNNDVLTGDVLLLFAVLTFSMYLTLGKNIIEKYGALKASTFIFLVGSIFYIPLFVYDLPNLTFANLTYKGIIGYFYLSFIVAYLAYFIWYYALKNIQVSKLTTLSNISPLLTV